MSQSVVTVLSLGGTIAMTPSDHGGVVPTLSAQNLIAAVPAIRDIADIEAISFRQIPGAHLQYQDLEELAAEIERIDATAHSRGVIVTQGTDTIEETAFTLDCLLNTSMPVVVTGAMRNPALPGADGPANLLASTQVAISEEARGLGVLVVMNDEIHAARFVCKHHTSNPAAFASPLAGRMGWVGEGRARIVMRPIPNPGFPFYTSDTIPVNTALITVGLGDNELLVETLNNAAFDGVVIEATGGGHVSPSLAEALSDLAQRMPVVLASRTGVGEILSSTYGFVGGEIDLQKRGLIRAGWLDGIKAKVVLTLLLRNGHKDIASISKAFNWWGGGS